MPALASPEGEADGGQAPGALHHVMDRGIDGTKILSNRKDWEDFLERLASFELTLLLLVGEPFPMK
jgi:hypothetical protein